MRSAADQRAGGSGAKRAAPRRPWLQGGAGRRKLWRQGAYKEGVPGSRGQGGQQTRLLDNGGACAGPRAGGGGGLPALSRAPSGHELEAARLCVHREAALAAVPRAAAHALVPAVGVGVRARVWGALHVENDCHLGTIMPPGGPQSPSPLHSPKAHGDSKPQTEQNLRGAHSDEGPAAALR